MIKNNKLSDRLNAYKNGEQYIDEEKPLNINKSNIKNIENEIQNFLPKFNYDILDYFINFIFMGISSFLYGIGLSAIFSTDWNYLKIFGVGYIFYNITEFLYELINKLIKNKNE